MKLLQYLRLSRSVAVSFPPTNFISGRTALFRVACRLIDAKSKRVEFAKLNIIQDEILHVLASLLRLPQKSIQGGGRAITLSFFGYLRVKRYIERQQQYASGLCRREDQGGVN